MHLKILGLILGGGVGSRLYPLTADRSKPAVPIGGKYRLIDIPISNCLNSGVTSIFVLTQFNSASLNQHIKNTYHFDLFSNGFVDILAAEQTRSSGEWFQGTADAVRQTAHHMENHEYDFVLIMAGDQLYQMDFEKMAKYHQAQNAAITIATIPVNAADATGFGIMKVNDQGFVERFIEKPAADVVPDWKSQVSGEMKNEGREYLASMGIYIFSRGILTELFNAYPNSTDFGKELIPKAIMKGYNVASYEHAGYWTDVGSIPSYYEANLELTEGIPKFNLFDNKNIIYTRPRLLAPSKITNSKVNRCLIAEGSLIQGGTFDRSIIGIRSRLGPETIVKDSIILGNDYFETLEKIVNVPHEIPMGIGSGCHIERAIIDKNCRIGRNVSIIGHTDLEDVTTDTHIISEGIIVIPKGTVLPDGTHIGYKQKKA